jgi:hypothetical protein
MLTIRRVSEVVVCPKKSSQLIDNEGDDKLTVWFARRAWQAITSARANTFSFELDGVVSKQIRSSPERRFLILNC